MPCKENAEPATVSNNNVQKLKHVSDVVSAPSAPPSSASDNVVPPSRRSKFNQSGRKKSFHSKVSTGCLTCKKRHVKCDETKPSCRKCTRGGRQCDGYVLRKSWIFEPSGSRPSVQSKSPKPTHPSSLPRAIFVDQGTHLEQRAFEYFSGVTAPMMVQWASSSAQAFWHDFVQRRAASVPAVRHLAAAVASQQTCTAGLGSDHPYFASRQYVKALSLLSAASQPICADTMLLCCSLVSVYEHFDPHTASSSSPSHLAAALRILHDPATTWTRATSMFYFMFQQVETVMSVLKNSIVLAGEQPSQSIDKELPVLPQRFQTSAEIQRKLFEMLRWRFIYDYYNDEWGRDCPGFLQLLASMRTFYSLLCDFIDSLNEREPEGEEIQVAMILKTQFRVWYAALWYSVDKETIRQQKPELVNLVGLSNPTKLVILVPVRVESQSSDKDWQPAAQSDRNERRTWPDMETIRSPRQPPYVRFTLYASRNRE